MVNFNGVDIDTITEMDSLLLSKSFKMNHFIDPYRGGYFGTSLAFKTKSGWFYNLSLKNLFPTFSKNDDSIDFTSVILSVGYVR